MIRIGKKFLYPHLCPRCHKLVILIRHPMQRCCPACQKHYHRKRAGAKRQAKKYNNGTYRRGRAQALRNQPYCALCGSTEHLTCHHTVNVRNGEWQGQHLTVLCSDCHQIWETKVNKLRSLQ